MRILFSTRFIFKAATYDEDGKRIGGESINNIQLTYYTTVLVDILEELRHLMELKFLL